jgi:flagellar hook-basal body complex protein FliE
MRVDAYSEIASRAIPSATPGSGRSDAFLDLLRDSVSDVNRQQLRVEDLATRSFAGEDIDPSVVATAISKTDIAFRTMIQIRTKLIDAFNELRNLQI